MEQIVSQFFGMTPLRDFKWGQHLSLNNQQELLQKTVSSDLCKQYPPSLTYRQLFVKCLIKQCEEAGLELADELYEVYANLVAQKQEDGEKLFKSYSLPTGSLLTLRESAQLVSGGTTGLRSWPAGQYLAEWATENKHIFTNKRVLELGSGMGLTGLAICDSCCPTSFTFSDCHQEVLRTLQENILLNIARNNCQAKTNRPTLTHNGGPTHVTLSADECSESEEGTVRERQAEGCDGMLVEEHNLITLGEWCSCLNGKNGYLSTSGTAGDRGEWTDVGYGPQGVASEVRGGTTEIKLCALDWENVQNTWLQSVRADIILAADVIYDTRIINPLVEVLCSLLRPADPATTTTTSPPLPTAYVASTIRNEDTFNLFLKALDAAALTHETMAPAASRLFHYSRDCHIQVLRISWPHQAGGWSVRQRQLQL